MRLNRTSIKANMKSVELEPFILSFFAIVCSYLILFLPVSGAVEIGIYNFGSAEPDLTIDINPEEYIDVAVEVELLYDEQTGYDNIINFDITKTGGSGNVDMNTVHIYRCLSRDVKDCIENIDATEIMISDQEPQIASDSYSWANPSDHPDLTYFRTENFLVIVDVTKEGTDTLMGFWEEFYRETPSLVHHYSYKLDSLDIYLTEGYTAEEMQDYIENHQAIPLTYIDSAVFNGFTDAEGKDSKSYDTESLYKAAADNIPADFDATGAEDFIEYIEENELNEEEIDAADKTHMLVFPEGQNSNLGWYEIASPILFEKVELGTCGNSQCDIGENIGNCCVDCPLNADQFCEDGNYCDPIDKICKATSELTMRLKSDKINLFTCSAQTAKMSIIITAVDGLAIDSASFQLEFMDASEPMACVAIGDAATIKEFECSMSVPEIVEECAEGVKFTDNSLSVSVSFSDGDGTATKDFNDVHFDAVLASSCLEAECEEGYYCDVFDSDNPVCKEDLDSSNLIISSIEPTVLNFYNPAVDKVGFVARVGIFSASETGEAVTKPGGLNVDQTPACEIASCPDCPTAPGCNVVCTESTKTDSYDEYNCDMLFTGVPGFNSLLGDYAITPKVTFDVSYTNGYAGGDPTKEVALDNVFSESIKISKFTCGDGILETGEICCYDDPNGCPEGEYCDYKTGEPAGATCKSKGNIGITIFSVKGDGSPIAFVDGVWKGNIKYDSHAFDISHTITFWYRIDNRPLGLKTVSANFETLMEGVNGEILYEKCDDPLTSGQQEFKCEFKIQQIDKPPTGYLPLEAFISGIIRFNDVKGEGQPGVILVGSVPYKKSLPLIIFSEKTVCGNNKCEGEETASECCQDCYKDAGKGGIAEDGMTADLYCKITNNNDDYYCSGTTCKPIVTTCGDGKCEGEETADMCCQDCYNNADKGGLNGATSADSYCITTNGDDYYCSGTTCKPIVTTCGDGKCEGEETADMCCQDCYKDAGKGGWKDATSADLYCAHTNGDDYYCSDKLGFCVETLCPSGYPPEPGEDVPGSDAFCCQDAGGDIVCQNLHGGGPKWYCDEASGKECKISVCNDGTPEPPEYFDIVADKLTDCCLDTYDCPKDYYCPTFNGGLNPYGSWECKKIECGDGVFIPEAEGIGMAGECCTDFPYAEDPVSCELNTYCQNHNPSKENYRKCASPFVGDNYCASTAGERITCPNPINSDDGTTCVASCLDCGINKSPPEACLVKYPGTYCNINYPEMGCIASSCGAGLGYEIPGYDKCEPEKKPVGEDYNNCCIDCDCPTDTYCTSDLSNPCKSPADMKIKWLGSGTGSIKASDGKKVYCARDSEFPDECIFQNNPTVKVKIDNQPLSDRFAVFKWKSTVTVGGETVELDTGCISETDYYKCILGLKDTVIAWPGEKKNEAGKISFSGTEAQFTDALGKTHTFVLSSDDIDFTYDTDKLVRNTPDGVGTQRNAAKNAMDSMVKKLLWIIGILIVIIAIMMYFGVDVSYIQAMVDLAEAAINTLVDLVVRYAEVSTGLDLPAPPDVDINVPGLDKNGITANPDDVRINNVKLLPVKFCLGDNNKINIKSLEVDVIDMEPPTISSWNVKVCPKDDVTDASNPPTSCKTIATNSDPSPDLTLTENEIFSAGTQVGGRQYNVIGYWTVGGTEKHTMPGIITYHHPDDSECSPGGSPGGSGGINDIPADV
ncbi:MAG: hypothetical protein ABIF08_04755 [Nanoarchaeota archaeon]